RVLVLSPRPGRVIADVASPLPWPRRLADLDDPSIAVTRREIRRHLGWSGEEGERPSELVGGEAGEGAGRAREQRARERPAREVA
ncbi:MAG TPA: hypothetical protein VEY67_10245, partial [Candidatus Dormibacteraeota bacterium]|nr:hypothetical protein [Candidatus Dormibacteraeota bacterium]